VPSHLYEKLPEHVMMTDERGRRVPDYLRMILMCRSSHTHVTLKPDVIPLLTPCSKGLLGPAQPEGDTFDARCQFVCSIWQRGNWLYKRS
jgi:hypothetical protein